MDACGARETVLGLDVGVNSVGWALVAAVPDGRASRLLGAGVRVFDSSVEGQFEAGRSQPKNTKRREARLARRATYRRARRLLKIAHILQRAGLLPEGDVPAVLSELDAEIKARYRPSPGPERRRFLHVWPYWLRTRALDHPLAPHELGRALYHLAQRRGFLSNRLAPEKDGKEASVVKKDIAALRQNMAASGARTLGEHFAGLDPTAAESRIRRRWTARDMYEHEFEAIWTAQAAHAPQLLTPDLKKTIHRAIFYQRPLKSTKGLIGTCDLEPGRRRAPWALRCAQQFRLIQSVNNLMVITPDGELLPPTAAQRSALIAALEQQGSLKFAKAKEIMGLSPRHHFNLEEGGEKTIRGNATEAALRKVFGARWNALSDSERDEVVEDVRSIQKEEAVVRRARKRWGLDEEAAKALAKVKLEDGYCSLSRKAIEKVLPLMKAGAPFATARDQVYGAKPPRQPKRYLPAVDRALPALRNPAVHRALTELRKVVNAIVREHGKPTLVRIELARDMRRNAKQREEAWKKNRRNQDAREAAAAKIVREAGIAQPRPTDIQKVLLAQECNWECPYTGRRIAMETLVGQESQFDIEHIIPFSRSLDDSFLNKTLCYADENRTRKHNMTPFEAYGADAERWNDILSRVKKFRGEGARQKLDRFQMTEIDSLDDFASRQLNDTRYASRLAAEYVGALYGGVIDAEGRRRVQIGRGGVTAHVRNALGLNGILGDGGEKTREDHRHHAVDALAVALTDGSLVKQLSDAARIAAPRGRPYVPVPEPWDGFLADARKAVEGIVVSRRVERKVNTRLHEDTYYTAPDKGPDGKTVVRVRKPVSSLKKAADIEAIVDPVVREAVRAKLAELGGNLKAFAIPANHPHLTAKDGRIIPIHKVRVWQSLKPVAVGSRGAPRHVTADTNHHMEIVEVRGPRGVRWEGHVVSALEAARRRSRREPVVKQDHGPGRRFLFSLTSGDTIEIDDGQGGRRLVTVRSVSGTNVEFCALNDARRKEDIKKAGDWAKRADDKLRVLNCRKVCVTALGQVRWAND